MKQFSKKISIAIGTAMLAVGLMALPVLANTTQTLGYGNGTSMMSNLGTQGYTSAGNSTLDNLVSAGTLTQAQEDSVLSSMQGVGTGGLKTALDSLITAGTLTQAQEDAVLSSMQSNGTMMGNQGSMQGVSMTSNHGPMSGAGMTNIQGFTHGTGMTSNRGSMQARNMMGNRGSMNK